MNHRLAYPFDATFFGDPGSVYRDRGKDYMVRGCREEPCGALLMFLPNPKTGRLGVVCILHGENHFRCCADPQRFQ